jgi:hypothetical protein
MSIVDKQILELLQEMSRRWGNKLNKDLQSIKFSQTREAALLELTFKNGESEIVKETTNLDFISGEDFEELFKPENDVVDNAQNFVDLDGYSLINCIGNLFNEEAAEEINNEHLRSLAFRNS